MRRGSGRIPTGRRLLRSNRRPADPSLGIASTIIERLGPTAGRAPASTSAGTPIGVCGSFRSQIVLLRLADGQPVLECFDTGYRDRRYGAGGFRGDDEHAGFWPCR